MWLDHPVKSSFPLWWNVEVLWNWEDYRFMVKLKALKRVLKSWNLEFFGDFRIKKEEVLSRISLIDSQGEDRQLDEAFKEEQMSLKLEFVEQVKKEIVSWRQKAKVRWAKEGDCSSAFFHRVVSSRRSKNYIWPLENEREVLLKGEEEIEDEILSFSSNLFAPQVTSKPFVEGVDWWIQATRGVH